MLGALFHHFIPASLYGGSTAFAALSKIDRELRQSSAADAVAGTLEKAKADLYAPLRARFSIPAAQALDLKILNLLLGAHHFRSRHTSVQSRPFGLVADPSNMCLLACPGCVHSARSESLKLFDWPNGTLSQDRFSSLLKTYGPYAIGVYFCNYGEPLLNLNTPQLIRAAKRYLMWTGLSTSLSVSRFDPGAYVESGLDFMVLSIDGASQATYERYRRNGNLELVLDNVRRLIEARRARSKKTPVLSWNYLAFEHNAQEIGPALRIARHLGVDQFRVVHPFDVSWDAPEILIEPKVKAGVRRLNRLSRANSPENWNPFPDNLDSETIARAFETPLYEPAPYSPPSGSTHTCHWLYKNLVMDAAGRILPCCSAPQPDADLVFAKFDGNGDDPFNSPKYRQARSFFADGTVPSNGGPYCTRCEWDQTNVSIGAAEIRRYFRAADPAFFDRGSLRLMSDW